MNKKINDLISRRQELIAGGAHTYSKGDDQFPANAPAVVMRGKGAYVWGSDGKKYLDWCMGLRSVSLGHCYPSVNAAVAKQMKEGTNFGRPHIKEFELADMLTKLLPGVEMVKFAKNGSTVTTAATKLARAFTGRKYIAVCASHPFFSYDDWFIGTTPAASGIPEEIKKLTLTFKYNDFAGLEKLFAEHPKEIACVIMEAVTTEEPKDDFLKKVENLTKSSGAVFIIDEMITGFRFGLRGAAERYGLRPDLVTYGKGIANGYSVAVLGGRRDIMDLGGINNGKERVFLVSTTHGAETIGLAAAIAAINEMRRKKVAEYFWKAGAKLKVGLEMLIKKYDLTKSVVVAGFAPNLSMAFMDETGAASPLLRTIFLQEVIKRGVLFQGYFAISFLHKEGEIKKTLAVMDEALEVYKQAFADVKNRAQYLRGPVCKPVFRKYN